MNIILICLAFILALVLININEYRFIDNQVKQARKESARIHASIRTPKQETTHEDID